MGFRPFGSGDILDRQEVINFLEELTTGKLGEVPFPTMNENLEKTTDDSGERFREGKTLTSSDNNGDGSVDDDGEPRFQSRDISCIEKVKATLHESSSVVLDCIDPRRKLTVPVSPLTTEDSNLLKKAIANLKKVGGNNRGAGSSKNSSDLEPDSDDENQRERDPRSSAMKVVYVQPATSPEKSDPDDETYTPPGQHTHTGLVSI